MTPRELLSFHFAGNEVVPHYFLERDHLWLRALLDEYERYEGQPRGLLADRLADPLPVPAPADKLRIARHVLDGLWRFEARAEVKPPRARSVLFAAGARHPTRSAAVSAAAATLGVEPEALLASLFADLPPEKRVLAPEPAPSPAELAQRANLSLVAGMLGRAVAVSIVAGSDLRSVVRVAKLRGLLCTVEAGARGRGEERLEISGPYALFRRTTMYGRALASLVPVASRCQEMELRAACVVDGAGATRTLVIRSGDPLYAGAASRRHDSKLEARFHKDFARAAPDWDVVREPAAVPAGGTLIFPDFELRHRRDPARRWLVEVMGFWTPTYVRDKLQRLGSAALDRFILCIDEERNCSAEELPASARVIRFRRHIDPVDVLRIVEP